MKVDYIEKMLDRLKKAISEEMTVGNYDMALSLISVCASTLYQTNIRYTDDDLEHSLEEVGHRLKLNRLEGKVLSDDTVLFWDGFGVNDRGLIQIYMKALCKIKKVVYVTYEDRKDQIPDVQDILDQYDAERHYIKRNMKSTIDMVMQLNEVIAKGSPAHIFFYSLPDDVVATPLLYAYKGTLKRYQVNLTDHAFWLGAGCCDKCINFRAYGAKVSKEYRNIEEDRNVVIPFYPVIHKDREFQGFPFAVNAGQKVIFSGGALYKTISDDNRYYTMVDYILSKYSDVIFWYAGSGDDTELKKILSKYSGRAFHTAERSDLFQVLENCDVYLSTYPMCGGLMLQYSATAGTVPVTLKQGNISDEFLIDQEFINIEFENEESLYEEIDRLLSDKEYAARRSELMKKSVISPDIFEEEVKKLVDGQDSDSFKPIYEHIDTEEFRNWYLTGLSDSDVDAMIVRRNAINAAVKHYPLEFLRGGYASCVENSYETAVIVLTYKPVISKLLFTLDSIVRQKYADMEVVVSDDGSAQNYFTEIIKYFEEKGFTDYSIVLHRKNSGTVRNTFSAANIVNSKYVKLISPGDALISVDTIGSWTEFLKRSGRLWSFGDALYYRRTADDQVDFIKRRCNPQIVDCYLSHKDAVCRMNYVGFDDIALGAAVLCDTELMLRYLKKIIGKVMYAEDNSYRIMVFDNILPEYYPKKVIIYECEYGVSTSGDKMWSKKIETDWKNTNEIMLTGRIEDDDIQKKIVGIYKRKYSIGRFKWLRKLFDKGQLRMTFIRNFMPRMSATELFPREG